MVKGKKTYKKKKKRKKVTSIMSVASVLAGDLSAHSDGQSLSKQNASFKTIETITTGEQKKAGRTQVSGATIGPTRAWGGGACDAWLPRSGYLKQQPC